MYYSFKNIKYHKIIYQLCPTYGNDCIVVSYTTQVIFSCFHNLNPNIYLNIFVISLSTRLRALSHFQMNLIEVLTKIRFTCFSREQHMIFVFKKSFLEFGFSLLPCVLKMLLLCCNLCAEDCAKEKMLIHARCYILPTFLAANPFLFEDATVVVCAGEVS